MSRDTKLTRNDIENIWLRYQVYLYNRPSLIAHEYSITPSYVAMIGRNKVPCLTNQWRNRTRRSHSTSSRLISKISSNG